MCEYEVGLHRHKFATIDLHNGNVGVINPIASRPYTPHCMAFLKALFSVICSS